MRNIIRFFQLSAIVLASVGCSDQFEESVVGNSADLSDRATLSLTGAVQSKVVYAYESGVGLKSSWEGDESISIFSEDGTTHLIDFVCSETSADGTATFIAESNLFAFEQGVEYKIVYPATDTYVANPTLSEFTQSASGDTTHLDGALVMEADYTYDANTELQITLESNQCVVRATISNLDDWVPSSVTYAIGSQSVKVNLTTYTSGNAVVYIPSDPQDSGSTPTFTVTYDSGSTKSDFELGTLSKDHEAGVVYSLTLNMGNVPTSATAGDATATSATDEIIIPLGVEMTAVSTEGFTLSVVNDDFSGAQYMAIKSAAADGENLVLTLTSPIYSDDTVKISYSGESVSANDGYTKLVKFTDKVVSLTEPTNLINTTARTMHDFEDGGGSNKNNNGTTCEVFKISSDKAYTGNNSLYYSKSNVTEYNVSGALVYYIGNQSVSVENTPLKGIAPDSYVARINIYMVSGNSSGQTIQVRFKGYTADSTTALDGEKTAAVPDLTTYEEWLERDITVDLSTYTANETMDGYLAMRVTNSSGSVPDISFYTDNIRFFKKSDLYRSEAGSSVIPDEPDDPVEPDDEDGFTIGGIGNEGNLFGDE